MPSLERNFWPLGWIPSDDSNNGRKDGLLRMDNLTLDKKGALSLIPGTKKISSGAFGSTMLNIYSRYMNGKKYRYVHSGTEILRNYGGAGSLTSFDLGFLSGGIAQYSAFGTGFGHVFACCGTVKRRDNGTNQYDMGITSTGAPTLSVNAPSSKTVSGTFANWDTVAVENDSVYNKAAGYIEADTDPSSLRSVMQLGYNTATTIDGTDLGGTGKQTDNDTFSAIIRVTDTSTFVKVRLEFLLQAPTATSYTNDVANYYWHEWKTEELRQGINIWNTVNCLRSEFERVGNDDALSWATIKGIRIIFIATSSQVSCVLADAKFEGGTTGPLIGDYEYKQVNVINTGTYLEISPAGPTSAKVNVKNASVQVTPYAAPPNVNEVWIYRRGGTDGDWRGVKILTSSLGSAFTDGVSDSDLILNDPGFDERYSTLNEYLENIPDHIVGMEGPFFGRMIYITQGAVYISEPNCPSLYDTRHVYENSSATGGSEINLFITKVSDQEILIGSTQEIYSFRGRGDESDDGGLLDFIISPLGIKQPPIDSAHSVESNSLLYHANDGWRVLAGSNSDLITKELDVYYRGQSAQGIGKVRVEPNNGVFASCCYGKGRILLCVEHITNGRLIHCYNTITKTWELPYINSALGAMSVFTEEDGTVICSSDTDKYLRELFIGTLFDEATKLPVQLTTVYDDNGQPFNRKDTSVLKICADTGGDVANVVLKVDGSGTTYYLGSLSFTGKEEKYFKIKDTIGKKKSFQLEITGNFSTFVLYGFGIEHEVLPKQEAIIRIPNNNLGNTGRKRFISFPMVLDCLGNTVTVTPIIDDVNYGIPATFNNDGKKTERVYFTSETTGTDLGVLIEASAGYFELYDLPLGEAISEQLPSPTKYLVLSNNNLGTNARKRFNNIPFVCDTKGGTITVIPVVDGVNQTSQTFSAAFKKTFVYEFKSGISPTDTICTDLGFIVSSNTEFEFYGLLKPKEMEILPDPIKYLRTSEDNFGIFAYKQFNNIPIVMNTGGATVTVIPILDGVQQLPQTFVSTYKKTHIYQFPDDVTAIDVALILSGTDYFEFYGLLKPQSLEVKPELVNFLRIPYSNYGVASKKRVRVIPMTINTFGADVIYTPIVDGSALSPTTLNTSRKQTVFHYITYETDVFGIDIGGTLDGVNNFEFYGLEKPEVVETLPVGKRFDQFGPIEFDRQGMVRMLLLNMMTEGTTIGYKIYRDDVVILTSSFTATVNKQQVYTISMPKGVYATVCRFELYSTSPFYVFDARARIAISGNDTDLKTVRIKSS